MQWANYREEFNAWKSSGRKGSPPPKSPDELKAMQPVDFDERKDNKNSEIPMDIEGMVNFT